MNKSNLWGLLIMTLCMVYTSGYTQDEELTKEICDQKAESILQIAKYLEHVPKADIDDMMSYINPCVDNSTVNSPKSTYVKGLLHFQKKDSIFRYGRWFEASNWYLSTAAANGYAPAKFTHNLNLLSNKYYKKYLSKNYGNIERDFESLLSENYKTDISNYVLGYLHLKNLGNIDFPRPRDINDAKNYFESSSHPMAKHWLAIMHYFGYGVPQDRVKGLQMLTDNDIYNSRVLRQNLMNQNNDWIPISAEELFATIENNFDLPEPSTIGLLKTVYHGDLIEFDGTGIGVKRRVPITFSIEKNREDSYGNTQNVYIEFEINGELVSQFGVPLQHPGRHDIHFRVPPYNKHLKLPALKNLLQDHSELNTTTYLLNQLNLKEATIEGKLALIVRMHATIVDELEETIPTKVLWMILYPESYSAALVAEPLTLDKKFATVAPNPIGNQFTITYTLDQEAEVQVGIYDFFGQQRIQVPTQKSSAGDTQTITVNSVGLSSGTYIIQMTVNGAHYSKMVIKE